TANLAAPGRRPLSPAAPIILLDTKWAALARLRDAQDAAAAAARGADADGNGDADAGGGDALVDASAQCAAVAVALSGQFGAELIDASRERNNGTGPPVFAVLGASGGAPVPSATAQVIINLVAFHEGVGQSIARPRVHTGLIGN